MGLDANDDESIKLFNAISMFRNSIIKECYEVSGIKLGDYEAKANFKNYIIGEPIAGSPAAGGAFGDGSFGDVNSEFTGAGPGKLPIPPGFPSDKILYEFISQAEGKIGVQWVSTFKGHNIVTSAACFGYDFPGGVHDPSFISKLGLTQSDAANLGITNNGRKPIGAESYGGKVQWGWYTKPFPASHPYWKKLIPVYRDNMIWAWNQPGIQAITSAGEKLARMHTINWYGHHYMRGLTTNDVGFKHRLQVAQKVCGG